VPPGSTNKRRSWPWILGGLVLLLVVIVGLGAALAVMVPRMLRASANRNRPAATVNQNNHSDENANDNSAGDANANESDKGTDETLNPPPTDSAKVLTDLADLENEWTVANINADKKALDRILADDYVGISEGRQQGKKQYLSDIQRDTSIEKCDFEDLKVTLNGDRATLTGVVKFIVRGSEQRLRFTDKFVWRNGRWQATFSQVDPLK